MKMVIAASILALTCGVAQAATCKQGNVTFTLTQGDPDAVKAQVCSSGNDSNTISESFKVGGVSGWTPADKVEKGGTTNNGNASTKGGFYTFSNLGNPIWSVLNPLGYEHIMVTIKQGNSFAAFLLDSTAILSGTWSTKGSGGSKNDYSHASVYFSGEPAPAPVPLPAGAALLPAGLAAFAFLRRRRKAA